MGDLGTHNKNYMSQTPLQVCVTNSWPYEGSRSNNVTFYIMAFSVVLPTNWNTAWTRATQQVLRSKKITGT